MEKKLNDLKPLKENHGLRKDLESMLTGDIDPYFERNVLVALLSKQFPSFLAATEIDGWYDDWKFCVYMTTPQGQVSFHLHDSHLPLFDHLEVKKGDFWDGSTKEQVFERLFFLLTEK